MSKFQTIILTTWNKYITIPHCAIRKEVEMSEVKEQGVLDYSVVASTFNPYSDILVSDGEASKEDRFDVVDLRTISTEGSRKISLEDLAELVVTVVPNIVPLTSSELDFLIDRSKKMGAVDEHINSIEENVSKLKESLDRRLTLLESISARL